MQTASKILNSQLNSRIEAKYEEIEDRIFTAKRLRPLSQSVPG